MAEQPIFDCGKFKVIISRPVPDGGGGMTTDRIPRFKHVWGLDTKGNDLPIKTHNAAANKAPMEPYPMTILQCKWNEGWVPFLKCPQGTEHARWLPAELQGKSQCKIAADGHAIGMDAQFNRHPCACVVALKAARQKANALAESKRDPGLTVQQKLLEATQSQAASSNSAIERLATIAEHLISAAKDGKK